MGIIAKDQSGTVLACWAMKERSSEDQPQDMAETVKLTISKAAQIGWRHIQIAMTRKQLVDQIQRQNSREHRMATLLY